MKNKMLKKIFPIMLVFSTSLFAFSGCDSNKSSSKTSNVNAANMPVDINVNGKSYSISKYENIYQAYDEDGVYFNYDKIKGSSKERGLTIDSIGINDDLSDVEKIIKKGCAVLDYEYDPYGDGCTDVSVEIYNGTMIDFDEKDVLDCDIIIYYIKEGESWRLVDLTEKQKLKGKDCLIVEYDMQGPALADEEMKEKKVRRVSCKIEKIDEEFDYED